MIAVKSTSGRIVILTTDSGDLLKDFENDAEGEGSNLLFSDCGQFIVDGSWDGFLTVRDASTGEVHYRREYAGEMLRRVHSVRSGTVWIIQHSPKATTRDQPPADGYFTIWTWPFLDGAPSAVGIHLPCICSSAFSEDGSRLAVLFGAPPRDLHVYELPSGRLVWQDRVTIGGSGSHLRFSRSGIFLASVQKDCVVHYCAVTGRRLELYSLPYPSDVAYSPDGLSIALGSWNSGEIRHVVTPGNKNGEQDGGGQPATRPESI